jgi:hypothetical protein
MLQSLSCVLQSLSCVLQSLSCVLQSLSCVLQSLSCVPVVAELCASGRPGINQLASLLTPCRAFCIEKNSTAPPLEVVGDASLRAALVSPYVEYLVTEVMKNGMQVSSCCGQCCCAADTCKA